MKTNSGQAPVLGFSAPSGTGKTTLLTRVISLLKERSLEVGVVKQARDDFDVDIPGKDSYELRKAGVERLLLTSEQKSALIWERPGEPELRDLLNLLDHNRLDLVLVEGFNEHLFPKIELFRQGRVPTRYPNDPTVIALATDQAYSATVPVLDINDPLAVANFIIVTAEIKV